MYFSKYHLKNYGIQLNDQAVPPSLDQKTSVSYFGSVFKDSGGVYFYSSTGTPIQVEGVDQHTFFSLNPYYYEDSKNVYYYDYDSHNLIHMSEADIATFQLIGAQYAKDMTNAYYGNKIISSCDTSTLQFLGEYTGHSYARDANHVYSDGQFLPDADPNTFNIPKVIVPME